jgi:alkylation response protein AidB-like acyl-CoA dehydrogenase
VNLDLIEDQAAVADLFATFFARESPSEVVRAAEPDGFDSKLWARLADTGALSMGLADGGAGLFELVLCAEAAGRHLAPVPFVEHVVAARLLERAGVEVGDDVLTLALRPDDGRLVPAGAIAPAFVACAGGATVLVRGEPGALVPNTAALPLADRSLDGATALGDAALHARSVDEWRLLMAACLVGLCESALQLGVDYVTQRHQFGVPIGSFQAVQHGLAELPGPLSGARLLARRAAWRVDEGEGERFAVDAAMALAFATDLARTTTQRVLHFHGGYGVMEEYDIQLHYRRARGWPAQLGDPAKELVRLAALLRDAA